MSVQEFNGQEHNDNYRKKIYSESEVDDDTNRTQQTRCKICRKKVGILGFVCKCSNKYDDNKTYVFCSIHRHPEEHSCTIDYQALGKTELTKKNPVVSGDKVKGIN